MEAGMTTIPFKDGSTFTVPYSSVHVSAGYVHVLIDGNRHTFNRRILDVLPPELDAGNTYAS